MVAATRRSDRGRAARRGKAVRGGWARTRRDPWPRSLLVSPIAAAPPQQLKLCASPAGYRPCSCIHEVASGTRAEEVAHVDGPDRCGCCSGRQRGEGCRGAGRPSGRGSVRHSRGPARRRPAVPARVGARGAMTFYLHSKEIASGTTPGAVRRCHYHREQHPLLVDRAPAAARLAAQPRNPARAVVRRRSSPNNWYIELGLLSTATRKAKASPSRRAQIARQHGAERRWHRRRTASGRRHIGASQRLPQTLSLRIDNWTWVDIVLETYASRARSTRQRRRLLVHDAHRRRGRGGHAHGGPARTSTGRTSRRAPPRNSLPAAAKARPTLTGGRWRPCRRMSR